MVDEIDSFLLWYAAGGGATDLGLTMVCVLGDFGDSDVVCQGLPFANHHVDHRCSCCGVDDVSRRHRAATCYPL